MPVHLVCFFLIIIIGKPNDYAEEDHNQDHIKDHHYDNKIIISNKDAALSQNPRLSFFLSFAPIFHRYFHYFHSLHRFIAYS